MPASFAALETRVNAAVIARLSNRVAVLTPAGSGVSREVEGIYDLTKLTIADGEDTVDAYLQLTAAEDGSFVTFDVPMAYYAADDQTGETYQDALLSIVLDGDSGEVTDETYYAYDDAIGTYGELTADPSGVIVPEVLTVLPDGAEQWSATSDSGLYADLPSLVYDLADLESGTRLSIELTVVDYGGNSDSVSAVVTIP